MEVSAFVYILFTFVYIICLHLFSAVKALARLPSTPVAGVVGRINPPMLTFTTIPQSPTHYKVVFYSSYCLDIYVRSENHILIRDAAISLFNQGKAMEDIQPIPFIKNFLLKYVDEAALQRRQSQAAEDLSLIHI